MSDWSSGYVTDVGYTHGFYRELMPICLTLLPLLKGLQGIDANSPLMVCELGCGQGFSANLIAAANPQIEYYATDFNPTQVHGAKLLAAEAETTNVHFFECSFADFLNEPALPEFDIITLHGIYSWVAPERRAEIVEFIRRKLRTGGLVYVSYNALPGWTAAAPMRHLMKTCGVWKGGTTTARLNSAVDFLGKMNEAKSKYFLVNPNAAHRLDGMKTQNRNYMAHEFLNETWTLFYHSEVAAELADAKMTFVGSAAMLENIDHLCLTPEQATLLAQVDDPVMRETVRDFMINQGFRRDVFLRGPVHMSAAAARLKWLDARFVLNVRPADIPPALKAPVGEVNLKAEVFGVVGQALSTGPKTVRQLITDGSIAGLGWSALIEALIILVGAGHAQPCLNEKGDKQRAQRTKVFNKAVMNRALVSADLGFLASPLTGGGIAVDRFSQLFLLAQQQKHDDPAQFAATAMLQMGQSLIRNGAPLATPEENLVEIRKLYASFEEKSAPILKQLGIS